jgi:hypothetical protein
MKFIELLKFLFNFVINKFVMWASTLCFVPFMLWKQVNFLTTNIYNYCDKIRGRNLNTPLIIYRHLSSRIRVAFLIRSGHIFQLSLQNSLLFCQVCLFELYRHSESNYLHAFVAQFCPIVMPFLIISIYRHFFRGPSTCIILFILRILQQQL